ncbi:MAG: hypothetical protein PUE51_05700 [Veillonellaceae bacterium]|nr:hypothetical protein [Veillonellaceae bacterium]
MELTIKAEIAGSGRKYKDVADEVGIPRQTFYKKLRKDSFTLAEAKRIFDALGAKLVVAK